MSDPLDRVHARLDDLFQAVSDVGADAAATRATVAGISGLVATNAALLAKHEERIDHVETEHRGLVTRIDERDRHVDRSLKTWGLRWSAIAAMAAFVGLASGHGVKL